MYDAIIVGARCAGSPTAMLLARSGHRVLVVDRATFPSDTISTHFLQAPAIARLKRWGLLDRLMKTGCPPIDGGAFYVGDNEAIAAPFESGELVPFQAAPRRTILDKLLIDAAREAGAEVRESFYLESLLTKDGAVTGVVGRTPDEENVTEVAKVVIGADGRHSRVAELVGAAFVEFHPSLGCGYYGYYKGDLPSGAHFRILDGRCLITFPTHGGHVIIALWPVGRFGEIKRRPGESIVDSYSDIPDVGDALASATLTEKVMGSADFPSFVRQSAGPGWALVGDAAYHKDPTPADGINDAFRGAETLATELDLAFRGRKSTNEALADYEKTRVASTDRSLPPTLQVSSFEKTIGERSNAFMDLMMWRVEEMHALTAEART